MPGSGSRAAWLVALAAVGVGGWLAGSWSRGTRPAPEESGAVEGPSGEAERPRAIDATPLVPRAGDEGSLFHARLSSKGSPPPVAMDLLLATTEPAEAECVEDCPLALRVAGGDAGRKLVGRILESLDPSLRALARHPRTPAPFRAALEQRLRAHDAREGLRPGVPFRVLATGEPKPELGPDSAVVTMTLYDHADPVFDQKRPPRSGGGRLMIARRETTGADGRPHLVEGVIEIGEEGTTWTPPSGLARADAARIRTPAMGHFHKAGTVAALHLDETGRLHLVLADGAAKEVEADSGLLEAVRLVLRRA
jgi:hypothetical protein